MPATDDDRIDLSAGLRRGANVHGRQEKETRRADPDWPNRHAPYMVYAQSGLSGWASTGAST
jgi:hypothetical protein